MSATNSTTNYNLPQFTQTDKPTWLGDVNGAMRTIDTTMKANETAAATNAASIDNLETAQTTTASTVQSQGTAINNLQTTDTSLQTQINGLKSALDINVINTISRVDMNFDRGSLTGGSFTVARNSDSSIFKFYGSMQINQTSGGTSNIQIPITDDVLDTSDLDEDYTVSAIGVVSEPNSSNLPTLRPVNLIVSRNLLTLQWWNDASGTGANNFMIVHPCVLFNKSFGDTPNANQ